MIHRYGSHEPKLGEGVFIADSASVIGNVVLNDHASVWFGTVIRADVNQVRIGARTNLQDLCVVHVDHGAAPAVLAEDVTVGHRVILHGCSVDRGALIGMGAVVMDGARVGECSLVAAGSLVSPGTIIPPRSLALGSPARVKRELTEEELERMAEAAKHYVELGKDYLAESRKT